MANTSSAKKAKRAAEKRRIFNLRRKKTMKDSIKDISKLIISKDVKGAIAMLPTFQKAIDKALKTGVIKRNTAARMKSRIMKGIRSVAK